MGALFIVCLIICLPRIIDEIGSTHRYNQFHRDHPEVPKWNEKK